MSKEIDDFNRRYACTDRNVALKMFTTGTDKKPLTKRELKKLQQPVKDFGVLEAFITNPDPQPKRKK